MSKHWRKRSPKDQAIIPLGPPHCADNNTTYMQYEKTQTHDSDACIIRESLGQATWICGTKPPPTGLQDRSWYSHRNDEKLLGIPYPAHRIVYTRWTVSKMPWTRSGKQRWASLRTSRSARPYWPHLLITGVAAPGMLPGMLQLSVSCQDASKYG